jgi:hypothetical protein
MANSTVGTCTDSTEDVVWLLKNVNHPFLAADYCAHFHLISYLVSMYMTSYTISAEEWNMEIWTQHSNRLWILAEIT